MNYKDTNDYEVMYLIGENTEEAITTLYKKYKPIIVNLAYKYYKIIDGKGLELEDFIQEGYIGLDRAIKKYSLSKNCLFYTFANLCIERQMQSVFRNYKTKKQEILNNAISFDYELPYTDMTLGDIIDDTKNCDPLDDLLDKEYETNLIVFQNELSIIQAQIFELRYNGFKYDEIAVLLGISKKSVDSHLTRIRKKLEQCGFKKINV